MRKTAWILFLGIFLLAACEFDVPLTTEHVIPINQAVLGSWELVPEENDSPASMKIMEFSDTEYLVHYVENELELFFRAYAINVDGLDAIQLEAIGDEDGPVDKNHDDRYMVASYRIVDGKLETRTLNTELVSKELSDSALLRAAFIEHKENPELFNDPGFFKRVAD
jgi:hypothetical protein